MTTLGKEAEAIISQLLRILFFKETQNDPFNVLEIVPVKLFIFVCSTNVHILSKFTSSTFLLRPLLRLLLSDAFLGFVWFPHLRLVPEMRKTLVTPKSDKYS